jgi:putative acyl-CoA dehydrogenase
MTPTTPTQDAPAVAAAPATPSVRSDAPAGGRPWIRDVLNQAPPSLPRNFYDTDAPLVEAVERYGAGWRHDALVSIGRLAGSQEAWHHSQRAERNAPQLLTHDRYGNRIDEVQLDPSWFWLLDRGVEFGIHASPWAEPREGAHVARAAAMSVWGQVNSGVMCPISMTYAVMPALRFGAPALAAVWEPGLTSLAPETVKLAGMAMTERQGGSDVRANTTRAEPLGGGLYELWGHKWFCSYPPCDIFLVLAQAPGGLSCFLVERGSGMEFQRLKDKLGSRSLPSSEVEFRGAVCHLVGEEGRGVRTIVEMVNHTRLDCLLSTASGMRRGLTEAVHHTSHRAAFGRPLVEQPLMRNVLADLALESEAATAAAFRVAAAYDGDEPAFRRIATAIMKYWVCKRGAAHAAEALECLGGNGYVEDSGMPLIYRDIPLAGIWEGSGNVMALDVLRALGSDPDAGPAFLAECELGRGSDRALDTHLDRVSANLAGLLGARDLDQIQFGARRLVEDLAVALQASLLVRHAPSAVADAFCASRLGGGGRVYGTLPDAADTRSIIDRVAPA